MTRSHIKFVKYVLGKKSEVSLNAVVGVLCLCSSVEKELLTYLNIALPVVCCINPPQFAWGSYWFIFFAMKPFTWVLSLNEHFTIWAGIVKNSKKASHTSLMIEVPNWTQHLWFVQINTCWSCNIVALFQLCLLGVYYDLMFNSIPKYASSCCQGCIKWPETPENWIWNTISYPLIKNETASYCSTSTSTENVHQLCNLKTQTSRHQHQYLDH